MMIIFLILIVVAIYYVARYFGFGKGVIETKVRQKEHEDVFEILRNRYANGEIDTDEYEEMKRVIQEDKKHE